ncbi:MAG: hypothetical protein ABIZ56_03135, partial [Chthoniobacteraceae bacterium]
NAMEEIRKTIYKPSSAWVGWTPSTTPLPGDAPLTEGSAPSVRSYRLKAPALSLNGEGGQRSWSEIVVDMPNCLKDGTGEQWYRIRSLGAADIPGGRVVAGEKIDNALRKFSLVSDRRTGQRVAGPQSTRMIEAIAKPVGAFRLALLAIDRVDLTDQNIVVDSYNSRDTAKSTNGRYDPAKRQENGDVATNCEAIQAGRAQIYGDAMTNGGTVFDSDNVTGEIRDDFYQSSFAVRRPDVAPDAGTPAFVRSSATLTALPGKPSNYQLSTLDLSGNEVLAIKGAPDGSPTYIQIIVTGNISVTGGQAAIKLDPGVYARIFVEGDANIAGRGFINPNSALHLQIYGVDPATRSTTSTLAIPGKITIAGNGGFSGAIYAPSYDVALKGGGTTDSIFGAIVGKTITMTGVQSVHYDEALARAGLITDFKIASWFEDER